MILLSGFYAGAQTPSDSVSAGVASVQPSLYVRGEGALERIMPPSPEPASRVRYADVPFEHTEGLARLDIPFYTLEGNELSIPIGISYAGGGIKVDEIAGTVGLGWSLEAGGCITRSVVDIPDEFHTPVMEHRIPSGELLDDLEAGVCNATTLDYLQKAVNNRYDTSLDLYSYSVCGLKGTFIVDFQTQEVRQLSGDGVLISYRRSQTPLSDGLPAGSISEFAITGPDGTVYTFSETEVATHVGRSHEHLVPGQGYADRWEAVTTWHLSSVRSRSGLETATLTYVDGGEHLRNVGSRSLTLRAVRPMNPSEPDRVSVECVYILSSYATKVLRTISLRGMTATFTYSQDTGDNYHRGLPGDDLFKKNFPSRLTRVEVRFDSSDDITPLKRVDLLTGKHPKDGRIVLGGTRHYTRGALVDRWDFEYRNASEQGISHYH